MREDIFQLGDAVMLVAIVGALVFAISYAVFFNWRKTSAGRSLMYFVASLVAWAIQSFFARMDPEYLGREWMRLVIYVFIAAAMWRMVWTLWTHWRKAGFRLDIREKEERSNGH